MKGRWLIPILLVLAAATLLIQFATRNGGARPGDTVSPRLVQEVHWQPGGEASLFVELVAVNEAGKSRRLGFLPHSNNPIADVQFYGTNGDPISTAQVELSHRC